MATDAVSVTLRHNWERKSLITVIVTSKNLLIKLQIVGSFNDKLGVADSQSLLRLIIDVMRVIYVKLDQIPRR